MSFSPQLTPTLKSELKNSVSHLALQSAEVQAYTIDISHTVKSILDGEREIWEEAA